MLQAAMGRRSVALIYCVGKKRADSGERLYCITRPNTGRNVGKLETYAEFSKRFTKLDSVHEAEQMWNEHYNSSATMCQHAYMHGVCRASALGSVAGACESGRRTRQYFVLAGSVLSVWSEAESLLTEDESRRHRRSCRMQAIRVRTDTDARIVGLLIPARSVRELARRLELKTGQPSKLTCFRPDSKLEMRTDA